MINISDIDNNKCFNWCFVRYVHTIGQILATVTKADKGFAKVHDLKNIKLPLKNRSIHKFEEKGILSA